ncbi:hypothetical protein C7S17_2054 [Burkholderia thailandensis]|nr:hypothetical protein [Burkholderia thailandensis]
MATPSVRSIIVVVCVRLAGDASAAPPGFGIPSSRLSQGAICRCRHDSFAIETWPRPTASSLHRARLEADDDCSDRGDGYGSFETRRHRIETYRTPMKRESALDYVLTIFEVFFAT